MDSESIGIVVLLGFMPGAVGESMLLRLGYTPPATCPVTSQYFRELPSPGCIAPRRCWAVLNLMQVNLNVRFESYATDAYGALIVNTTNWNGMVGMLINGTIDITHPDLTITEKRSLVVAYSHPVFIDHSPMFLACKRVKDIRSNVSFTIFGMGVWLSMLASGVAFCIQLALVIKVAHGHSATKSAVEARKQLFETIVEREHRHSRRSHGYRSRMSAQILQAAFELLLFVMLEGMVRGQLYDSLQQVPVGPFDNRDKFVASLEGGEQVIVVRKGTAYDAMLAQTSPFGDHRKLIVNTEDFEQLDHNRYVLFADFVEVVSIAARLESNGTLKCFVSDLALGLPLDLLAFGVQKGASTEWLNRIILRLSEAGILMEFSRVYDTDWQETEMKPSPKISLEHIGPPLYLCAVMMGISICVFLFEVIHGAVDRALAVVQLYL